MSYYSPSPEKLRALDFEPKRLLQVVHDYEYRLGGRRIQIWADPFRIHLQEYDPASRTWPQVLDHQFKPADEAEFDEVMRWRGWLPKKAA